MKAVHATDKSRSGEKKFHTVCLILEHTTTIKSVHVFVRFIPKIRNPSSTATTAFRDILQLALLSEEAWWGGDAESLQKLF